MCDYLRLFMHTYLQGIPCDIDQFYSVTSIYINNVCHKIPSTTFSIPHELGNLINLQDFILYNCKLPTFPEIFKLKNIKFLKFIDCNLQSIPEDIYLLKKIQIMDFTCNPLDYKSITILKSLMSNTVQVGYSNKD